MAMMLNELLGEKLVQHNELDDKLNEIITNQLDGKILALYFSAHWCGPCRNLTPKLNKIYKEINNEIKNKLDIIFISWDENEEDFNHYFNEMSWKSLPFQDRERFQILREKFNIERIPSLIVISSSFEIITFNGIDEIQCNPELALTKWSQGKCLFWSRKSEKDEYVWEYSICSKCFMKPLIGFRYGCENKECQFDLCETCLIKTNHEHPLIEYLFPKKKYLLEKILSSIPYLLDSKTNEQIETKLFLQNNIKSLGFYFSANWCPPCRLFTPELAELYQEIQKNNQTFHILFISSDVDEDSFNEYHSEMPWLAVPFNSTAVIKQYFQAQGIPSLFILSSDGQFLSRNGRLAVARRGIEALQTWERGEKLTSSLPEKFKWICVACDECKTDPIIGQRYRCDTCGNYDLCSTCQSKGHQHQLTIVPQPNDEDN